MVQVRSRQALGFASAVRGVTTEPEIQSVLARARRAHNDAAAVVRSAASASPRQALLQGRVPGEPVRTGSRHPPAVSEEAEGGVEGLPSVLPTADDAGIRTPVIAPLHSASLRHGQAEGKASRRCLSKPVKRRGPRRIRGAPRDSAGEPDAFPDRGAGGRRRHCGNRCESDVPPPPTTSAAARRLRAPGPLSRASCLPVRSQSLLWR